MRIQDLALLAVLIIGLAAADMQPQSNSNIKSSKILLSTLQELHSSLSARIDELSHMEATENSEKIHLLQHYTAQRNNIEREIASIQSIDDSHMEVTAARHILKNLAAEERSVPYLLNIFKKPKNPGQENLNENTEHSISHPPYYPGNGEQYPNPYFGQPTKPDHPNPSNDLVQGTFPGYEPPNGNHHQQTFINRESPTQSYQKPPAEQVSLQVPHQYTPPLQVMIQPLAQPPLPDPLGTQLQMEPYRPQAIPQQYQSPVQFEPLRAQPQLEPYKPQLEPYKPQPEPIQNRPQLGATPNLDAQVLQQQFPFGQKQGVFVYYPNGVPDEEEEMRPTIADRFGQAFDRVGQVISRLTNRQTLRSSLYSNNGGGTNQRPENSPERHRVTTYNHPRSNNEKLKVKTKISTEDPLMPSDRPKMATEKPMMATDRPMMATNRRMMPMAKPKMLWVAI